MRLNQFIAPQLMRAGFIRYHFIKYGFFAFTILTFAGCTPLHNPNKNNPNKNASHHSQDPNTKPDEYAGFDKANRFKQNLSFFATSKQQNELLQNTERNLTNPALIPHSTTDGSHAYDTMSVWYHIRKSEGIRHRDNRRIRQERDWYAKNADYLKRVFERAEPLLPYIINELKQRNMPAELALLPVVESAYNPYAYSRSDAAGLWQFIPSTGKLYDLRQDWWYDGRRDIIASTDAALAYLEYLHKRHGQDWLLALAAYNGGTGKVSRAVAHNKKYRKPADYWSLRLPKETRHYVPKLLALVDIVINPVKYGVTLPHIDMTPKVARVYLGDPIDLDIAAQYADTDLEYFYWLNAGFKRFNTGAGSSFELLIPHENKILFEYRLAQLAPEKRVQWTSYQIRPGDSLIKIAQMHQVNVSQIKSANNIHGSQIRAGKTLQIPLAHNTKQPSQLNPWQQKFETKAVKTRIHSVKRGETLWSISRKYNVSAGNIARWNSMHHEAVLQIGHKLKIKQGQARLIAAANSKKSLGAQEKTTANKRRVRYQVKSGDSLYRISRLFGVSVSELAQWNSLNQNDYLKPGQRLMLYRP